MASAVPMLKIREQNHNVLTVDKPEVGVPDWELREICSIAAVTPEKAWSQLTY